MDPRAAYPVSHESIFHFSRQCSYTEDNHESDISESYMSDSRGRRVTPRVVVPEVPPEEAQRKRTAAEKEADQTRKVAEQRARLIGPGIDREGATLVNDKRRQGFLDDVEVMEVVDDDDDDNEK